MLKNKTLIIAAISLFALNANAGIVESGTCNSAKTCKYELDGDGNMRIYGTGEIAANAFANRGGTDIKNVTIEKGITEIGVNAFANAMSLKNISLPKTLTSIKRLAFYNTRITDIIIPKSVTSIENGAFSESRLTDITVEGDNVQLGDFYSLGYMLHWGKVNFNVVSGSNTENRLKELIESMGSGFVANSSYTAYIPPKRTSYTIEEAMEHVSHDNHNSITFTFK